MAQSLTQIAALLRKQHGTIAPPPPKTAFEWVLWENVAYLANDERRAEAYALLKRTVGFMPAALLGATDAKLLAVTSHGIVAPLFARKLRKVGELARDKFDGRVDQNLSPDLSVAAKQLRVFPGIGEPGAEKILVAIGRARTLPLESNGLRVMQRLGFGQLLKSYSSTYRSVKAAIDVGRMSSKSLFAAHLLLQRHGRTVCKVSKPQCGRCLLRVGCAFGAVS